MLYFKVIQSYNICVKNLYVFKEEKGIHYWSRTRHVLQFLMILRYLERCCRKNCTNLKVSSSLPASFFTFKGFRHSSTWLKLLFKSLTFCTLGVNAVSRLNFCLFLQIVKSNPNGRHTNCLWINSRPKSLNNLRLGILNLLIDICLELTQQE